MPADADVVVIGAGIVGLATARALRRARPDLAITVLDKETEPGRHQSGRNSGVLHSGIYYRPGSRKARLCASGRAELTAYCEQVGIPVEHCGKVIVATRRNDLEPLHALHERGERNGLRIVRLDRRGLSEHEPHAEALEAIFVPAAGVVDFGTVTRALARDLVASGVELRLGCAVESLDERESQVVVHTSDGELHGRQVANCAGLYSDVLARRAGLEPAVRIVPFRGEYVELLPERAHLVRHLIYPVPDLRFPFLGVHLTRGIDGRVHGGPNAVLALAREGYRWRDRSIRHVSHLASDPAVWRLALRYWRTGLHEIARSVSRRLLVRDLRRLVPDIGAQDLTPAPSGVRAQAVDDRGCLVDDFAIEVTPRAVHVLNAPSPGATASFAIGTWLASVVLDGHRPPEATGISPASG
ncbi:L-2-hydroxyglutarate oxidase [Rhabdothermincola sediminis]|uniref:L-2-hydroxyglutarate oxidase n=1 Tax=Rhabdothermincola sediminis TaxID=2751370 RepID=UPI001AA0A62E|nr:L-2-hydroxyglutarate oxidase [Rhabdothermincola sediminis]